MTLIISIYMQSTVDRAYSIPIVKSKPIEVITAILCSVYARIR